MRIITGLRLMLLASVLIMIAFFPAPKDETIRVEFEQRDNAPCPPPYFGHDLFDDDEESYEPTSAPKPVTTGCSPIEHSLDEDH